MKLYREMELEMIRSMKRNFKLHLAEEGKTGISYPQWQAKKIKALRQFQTQVLKIQNDMLMHIPEKVSEHLQKELKEGAASEVRKYAGLLGNSSVKLLKDSFFDVDTNKITSLINALDNDLYKANTAVLRMMNDTYRQTIFKYEMFVANGVYTEKQAYDKAVKDFLDRGINCIEYKDGRRVNIADYTSMAIRTANQRAYMVGQGEFRKELGRTLIIISRHNTSCDLCKPFENKVLIDDVYSGGTAQDGDYMLLSDAMAKGLYHPRCRHGSSTYFPELEEIEKEFKNRETSEESKSTSDIAYAENQVQRFKRLSQGSQDEKSIEQYELQLQQWQRKITVAKSKNYDIISNEMFRKSSDIRKITPISEKRFIELTITARKMGAQILRGEEAVEQHLDRMEAAASTIGDTILFRKDVSISEVIEETYHFIQNKEGINIDKPEPLRTYLNEILAKQYLIQNAKKLKIPREENELTIKQLEHYKELLNEYKKEMGDFE